MKVKFILEDIESEALHEALENIPTSLCDLVSCPECEGDACEVCPMYAISAKWADIRDRIHEEILPMIEKIEEKNISVTLNSANGTIGGQMVRKMIEYYEKQNGAK